MKFGFIPTEGGALYREALAEVEQGEALGFDSVWMEEHHGVRNMPHAHILRELTLLAREVLPAFR